ncbi:MAG TPA: hypothetical protein VEF89_07500 [Solirubrobacteraceae bacterium]|nr:hypothetical protein [Solirubrobacteraceae bacterium]
MSTSEEYTSVIELIELSDLAWTIIDSDGKHESAERAWTAALPGDWAPDEGVDELRARLSEVMDAASEDGDRWMLEVVSAVIVYLAAHPERRRVEPAVIGEALREAYGQHIPGEIANWLAREHGPVPRHRHPGAPPPQRQFHSRPLPPAEVG